MKNSEITWIGEIPENWDIVPIYKLFSERKNKNSNGIEKNLLSLSYGKIKRRNIYAKGGLLPESFNTYNIVEPGDIIIRPTDLQNDQHSLRTGLVKEHGIITSAYICLAPISNTNSNYYQYLLHSYDIVKVFYNMGNGVRQGLNYREFSHLKVLLPSQKEQKRIANFLDKKCGQIDKLLTQINDEFELLKTYQNNLIIKAVTKGLDSNVSMKDSGIEWVGSIPESWNIVKGKFILTLLDRPTKKDDEVITCFRDGQVTLRKNRRTDGFTISTKEIGYQGVDVGDLVVHAMDGFAGAIGISESRGKASPVLNVMDSSENKGYLKYYLRSCAYMGVFNALAKGIRVRTADTRWSTLANLKFPLPTKNEQKDISDYLDQKCAEIRALINEKNRQLDLLTKYKNSLIFEYVTGKKQVPQI